MRRLCLVPAAVLLASLALPTPAQAQEESVEKGVFGVGLIIGEPTGVAAKLYLQDDMAIAGAVGSAFIGGGIQVHVDLLWHPWVLESRDSFVLPAYVGPGLRVLNHRRGDGGDDDVHVGVRAVAGILFDFKEIPLDVFAELAAVGDYIFGSSIEDHRGLGVDINAGLGARYYF